MWIQTKKLNRERVYTGLSFFGGRGPVWPGRGNTAALSPGPGSEHPAAWGRAPDSSPTMTEAVSFLGAKTTSQIKFTFARPPQPRPPAASATPQRAAPNNVCRANGGSGVGAPHPKATLTKDPGSRATWVRPTSPPSAPSGQRAADLTIEGRSGATSCGAPGPGSEHPAAWGRAPDSSPTMTEGAPQEVAPERPSIVKSAALCPDVEPKEARWAATKSPGTPDLFFGLPIFWGPIRHSTLWRYTAR